MTAAGLPTLFSLLRSEIVRPSSTGALWAVYVREKKEIVYLDDDWYFHRLNADGALGPAAGGRAAPSTICNEVRQAHDYSENTRVNGYSQYGLYYKADANAEWQSLGDIRREKIPQVAGALGQAEAAPLPEASPKAPAPAEAAAAALPEAAPAAAAAVAAAQSTAVESLMGATAPVSKKRHRHDDDGGGTTNLGHRQMLTAVAKDPSPTERSHLSTGSPKASSKEHTPIHASAAAAPNNKELFKHFLKEERKIRKKWYQEQHNANKRYEELRQQREEAFLASLTQSTTGPPVMPAADFVKSALDPDATTAVAQCGTSVDLLRP